MTAKIEITYQAMLIFISGLWILLRAFFWVKQRKVNWKRELQLILVYICIIVITRITFIPMDRVDGKLQPLVFDITRIVPFRINFIPIVYMFGYHGAKINFIGNIAMFIPVGIIWPIVFKELNTHKRVIAAGIGFPLCIEMLQLLFYDRVTDVNDLLLNSLGFLIGYGIYLLVKAAGKKR